MLKDINFNKYKNLKAQFKINDYDIIGGLLRY